MTGTLDKIVGRYAAACLTIGLIVWIEAFFTMEWSSPYCASQEDGPAYAAFGMPLPYVQFGGTSSLQYEFMPHIYFLNIIVLGALAFPAVRWTLNRCPRKDRTRGRYRVGVVGFGLLASRVALMAFLFSVKSLIPVRSIGDAYEPYVDFRPVGFRLNDGHYGCKPSRYWFPHGRKHD